MEQENVKLLIDIAQFVITGAIGIYLYLDRKHEQTTKRISQLETDLDDRLDSHAGRLATIEAQLANVPSHADLRTLAEDMAASKSMLQSVKESIDRLQNYLLNRK